MLRSLASCSVFRAATSQKKPEQRLVDSVGLALRLSWYSSLQV